MSSGGGEGRAARRRRTRAGRPAPAAVHAPEPADLASRAAAKIDGNVVLVAIALVGLHLLLAAATFQPTPHTGGDNAAYLSLARSLLERHDFTSTWDPALPPHTQYPPGFPAVLALAMTVGLQPWVPLKIVVTLFSAAAVALSFLWIRRRGRPLLALGVGALLAISPGALTESHWILSDVPFWAFTLLALWACERLDPGLRARFWVVVAATLLAYFTRSAGLPLVLAVLAWLALQRRWRQWAAVAGVLAPLALLWWLRARAAGGVDYVEQFWLLDPYTPGSGRIGAADLVARALENASKYLTLHLPILLAGAVGGAAVVLAGATAALGLVGWALGVTRALASRERLPGARDRTAAAEPDASDGSAASRRRRPRTLDRLADLTVAEMFLPLYLGLLLAWPAVWSGERFLLPVLPVILYYAGASLTAIAGAASRGAARRTGGAGAWVGAAAVFLIVVLAMPRLADAARLSRFCMAEYGAGERYPCLVAEWHDFFTVAETAREALPDDAVVLSRKPRLFYVLANRRGRNYPLTDDAGAFFDEVEDSGARYVVLDRLGRPAEVYLAPVLRGRTERFCVLYAEPATGTAMLGITDAAAPDSVTAAFPFCGLDHWRSAEVRDRVMRAMSAAAAGPPSP